MTEPHAAVHPDLLAVWTAIRHGVGQTPYEVAINRCSVEARDTDDSAHCVLPVLKDRTAERYKPPITIAIATQRKLAERDPRMRLKISIGFVHADHDLAFQTLSPQQRPEHQGLRETFGSPRAIRRCQPHHPCDRPR